MNTTSVAIIMPVYNCQDTLDRAIKSVITQTYENWHLYIINDKSVDDLDNILGLYKDNEKISIIYNESNLGAAESRNVGLRLSYENVISFIDSDDSWYPDKLMIQMQSIQKGYDIVISNYRFISSIDNEVIYCKDEVSIDDFLKKKIRVCFSSLVHKRYDGLFFDKIGHEDFLYIYKLLLRHRKVKVEQKLLVDYYDTPGSLSNNKKKAAKWHYALLKKFTAKIK
ncbi:glycosyltransferase family 2 protein [Klebsiella quasipneumoniae]|uniref:glycosyltransferase family 2 protein n=1 Tax=Klebsiella quasipneumoniae TaxID=1463165 RepID=UPI00388DB718